MTNILVIGATSAIAQETARIFATRGAAFYLLARNADKLQAVAKDLQVRGATEVNTQVLDLANTQQHAEMLHKITAKFPSLDIALLAYGTLGEQKTAAQNYATAYQEYLINFLSYVSWCGLLANYMEKQRSGTLAVISSVAGDRGRQSNYIYGSAKGGLSIFLQGLRNRLAQSGVHVVTIKPGFVDTPMTAHLTKGFLFASAHKVGHGIYRAIHKKKNVAYLPWFWFWIMLMIKLIPESIFKRLRL